MPNIHDYVQWRGDLTFKERAFTEADNLVLCQLSYIDLSPLFPFGTARDAKLRVREAIERLLARGRLDTLLVDGEEKAAEYTAFAQAAAVSRRFGDLALEDYVDIRDDDLQTQFAAVTFHLDETTDFVAFRGTDDSIVGWKEDFMISFTRVHAQDLALEYLARHLDPAKYDSPAGAAVSPGDVTPSQQAAGEEDPGAAPSAWAGIDPDLPPEGNPSDINTQDSALKRFYVGGHSKGANLALYAAAMLPQEVRVKRLLRVFVNDGPGLCADVIDPALTDAVDPITTKIVPEYDVIGKIFEMPITDNRIVRSSGSGVLQHGMITWQLREGGELDLADGYAPGSLWIGEVLDTWIGGVDTDKRAAFIDGLFDILKADGSTTFAELTSGTGGPEKLEKIIAQAAGTDPVTWDVAAALPRAAVTGGSLKDEHPVRDYLLGLFRRNTYSRGLALLAAGIGCMALPQYLLPILLQIILTAFLVYEAVYTARRLWQSRGHLSDAQTQVYILLFSAAAYFVVVFKENLLMLLSNLVFGGIFLFLSYRSLSREGREDPQNGRLPQGWNILEGVFLLLLAIVMLTAPFDIVAICTFILGVVLALDGIVHILSHWRERRSMKKTVG